MYELTIFINRATSPKPKLTDGFPHKTCKGACQQVRNENACNFKWTNQGKCAKPK